MGVRERQSLEKGGGVDQQCPALSATTHPGTEPVSGWTTRELRLAGALPTSLTPPPPPTDHHTPHMAPTHLTTMETPELGGHPSETAQLTTLRELATGVPPEISGV